MLYVQERSQTGTTKRIKASEVLMFLTQASTALQLQQQLAVANILPKTGFDADQLKYYLDNPPAGWFSTQTLTQCSAKVCLDIDLAHVDLRREIGLALSFVSSVERCPKSAHGLERVIMDRVWPPQIWLTDKAWATKATMLTSQTCNIGLTVLSESSWIGSGLHKYGSLIKHGPPKLPC